MSKTHLQALDHSSVEADDRFPWGPMHGDFLLAVLLFASVILVYLPVVHFDSINFDDPDSVFSNPHVLEGLTRQSVVWAFTSQTFGLWKPLTNLSYMVEVQFLGPKPGLMHLDNVILHALSTAGWYFLLRGMTGFRANSFFIAALFGLHPAHVESVAWITERKDVLSMFFMVASLLAYWRYTVRPSYGWYAASLTGFGFALMSKALLVTQPVLMLLLDFWPLYRTRWCVPARASIEKKSAVTPQWLILEKIPFFALAVFFSLITLHFQGEIGAAQGLQVWPLRDRLATATLGYVRYLGSAFWPTNLAIYYPYHFNVPIIVVLSAAGLLIILTATALRFGKTRPYLVVGWVWYLVTLFPVIGLFQTGTQSIADRYTYLPFVGLSIGVVWTVASLRPKAGTVRHAAVGRLLSGCGLLAVFACAMATQQYLSYWKNSLSLFSMAAQSNGALDWLIEDHLAAAYNDIGRPDLALAHYAATVELNPNIDEAQAHLANLLLRYSPKQAKPHYEAALRLKPLNAITHYNYGLCLLELKRDGDARHEFSRALELNPRFAEAAQALHDLHR